MTDLPEQTLWDALDASNFPFRRPVTQLVDEFGVEEKNGLKLCHIPTQARVIKNAKLTPRFTISQDAWHHAAPLIFGGKMKRSRNWKVNYHLAKTTVEEMFGPGSDTSGANTKSTFWELGYARIRVLSFPPERQQCQVTNLSWIGKHARTEATFGIVPAWRETLATNLAEEATQARPLVDLAKEPTHIYAPFVRQLTKQWPGHLPPLMTGLYQVTDHVLHVRDRNLVDLYPHSCLQSIESRSQTELVGRQWSSLILNFQSSDGINRRKTIARHEEVSGRFDAQAIQLAKQLNLDVEIRANVKTGQPEDWRGR